MSEVTYIPVVEVAKRISLSEDSLRRQLRQGKIRGMKLGRDWLIPTNELARLKAEYPLVEQG